MTVKEQLALGHFEITKIVESVGPAFELNFLLPDANPEQVGQHESWLLPNYVDKASGILIASFHSYLVKTPHHNILIDACVGNDKERPGFPEMHKLKSDYVAQLASTGLNPSDIDFVMCTHMHPDHVGWNTQLENGQWIPTFPKARYLFGQTEFDAWKQYHEEIAGTENDPIPAPVSTVLGYSFNDSVLPVIEAQQAVMIDDGHEIESGMMVRTAPGHSPGNFVVDVESNGRHALFSGDVMHHPLQIVFPEWSSGFCADPSLAAQTRLQVLEQISDTNTILMPAHFPSPTWGTVHSTNRGFEFTTE